MPATDVPADPQAAVDGQDESALAMVGAAALGAGLAVVSKPAATKQRINWDWGAMSRTGRS